jgi:glycine hydroxymethyltransferase
MSVSLIAQIAAVEATNSMRINMTPSENILSPLARLPFVLDAHGRYFLDDLRLFGRWFFPAGRDLGALQQDVLTPLLGEMAHSRHVNVRPISGINCMTVALAALTNLGETILTVPLAAGGHASTSVVAARLGLRVLELPFASPQALDLDLLVQLVESVRPALIYFDQSTFLFPIDPAPVRAIVDAVSPRTLIHYDSSHLNGLILGGATFNPLQQGADSFGGSTHKTLPGPHKGFFATDNDDLADRFQAAADHFVSHHHMASVLSLAITLMEMRCCGGAQYSRMVIDNARAFGKALTEAGLPAAESERGFSDCHQIWVPCDDLKSTTCATHRLERCGLIANNTNALPGLNRPGFRLSTAELTRRGATADDMALLADIFVQAALNRGDEPEICGRVAVLAERLIKPHYCFQWEDVEDTDLPPKFAAICRSLFLEAALIDGEIRVQKRDQ